MRDTPAPWDRGMFPPQYLVAVVAMSALAGCATSYERPTYIKTLHPLIEGRHVDATYRDPAFRPADYSTLMVSVHEPPAMASGDLSVRKLSKYLELQLISEFQATRTFSEVVAATGSPDTPTSALLCDIAITEVDPGSRALRWWFGEFGAGHSVVQVEGRLVEPASGKDLVQFVERRRGAAILDITGGDAEALVEQDLREIAEAIVKQVLFP